MRRLTSSATNLASPRGLIALRDDVRRQPALVERIRKKYRIKNTIGYSLNAFLDYDSPLEMLRHLLIGSEGTLAFLAEAVLHTVPDLPVKYTGLLFFRHIEIAAEAVVPLTRAGAAAIELMDRAALQVGAGDAGRTCIARDARTRRGRDSRRVPGAGGHTARHPARRR